ncbi:cbb3-type cytochrome c oxidase N-terminal domain-containing protein [Flavobacterium sp. 5]|uniref:cbb3-type cytochrome c oxidase N-terminal domain-containing protein n=1 Tax=Flavobacterium sp. 5 TaxID=2035199 RepID=UPI000C2CD29C|nr:cbb3-type cytochrome c oxidase N-terminal domain-containing protein [Flavobacterium sp. 5]PKB17902.1 cytochrome c oxidase cbb3-type subunit 3 [Flavobacterium sp. 5]
MKKIIPPYIRVLVLFFFVFGVMEYFIDSGSQPAFIKYPMVLVFLIVFLFLLIAIEITLSAVNKVTYLLLTDEEKEKLANEEALNSQKNSWYQNLMQSFTQSAPAEEEKQLLMDHDYDGIKELDNNLPPWWVYLFYACIVFAVVYLVRYEIMGAPDQDAELKAEMDQAKIEVVEYMKTAPDLMDEKTVVLLDDAASIGKGKEIFTTNCVACHRADAGGQIGPNLTDDYWILGGGIKNLFHTITNGGRDGKGMIAWKASLKPKEIQAVASYVISLRGSNPKDPKAPDGEIWVDENAPKTETASAVQTVDSTQVK